ncbi:MAG: FAD-dependent oxidoreductase [Trueperaceae bacterium]
MPRPSPDHDPLASAPSNVPVWEEGGWRPLPVLAADVEADVCVVGLGGSGLSAVRESTRLGQRVVGIDAGRVAGGAAGRNGGFLLAGTAAFHHNAVRELGRERAIRLYRRTLDEVGRIVHEAPDAASRVGSLRIADSAEELVDCRAQLVAMEAHGLPVQAYAGPEGEGLLFPEDAAFQPLRRCRALAHAALDEGASLYEGTPAVAIVAPSRASPGRAEVRTPGATIRAGAVIVAVDGRIEQVLPELEGRVRTARLQMIATAPTDDLRLARPVYRRYGFEYYQQTSDGRIALGGFRDHGGANEWTSEGTPGQAVQDRLERYLRERLGVRAPVTHRWAASVGFTSDILPVFAQVRPRVWAIGGYNGTGNVIGAILGRAAARLAATGAADDAELFGYASGS